MREGVAPDDRLVRLHVESGDGRQHLRQPQDLLGVDIVLVRHCILARADRHDGLLQRGIAGSFADAVDGAFHLSDTRLDRCQRVGDREAQVVMIVRRQYDLVGTRHAGLHHGEDALYVLGQGVADSVGDVDRRRTGLDRGFHAAAQKVGVGAGAVLGRPFHVIDELARQRDGIDGQLQHVVRLHPQLVFHVQRAGGQEDVDTLAGRRLYRLGGAQDVHRVRCEARPQITGLSSRWPTLSAIALTLSKSPGEAWSRKAGFRSRRCRQFGQGPRPCGSSRAGSSRSRAIARPSRSVVSKMMMRSSSSLPKLGWVVLMGCLLKRVRLASGVPLSETGVQQPGETLRGG